MTIDEITQLCGPDLDAAVAAEVMKRKPLRKDSFLIIPPWHPHIHIQAAWEVVEVMKERGYGFGMYFTDKESAVSATFYKKKINLNDPLEKGPFHFRHTGNNAPSAICRAALLAVREKYV